MHVQLSGHDTELLHELLRDYLPILRREVARTDKIELRHQLVERQELVERLIEKLAPSHV
jgi:hypothetical protein